MMDRTRFVGISASVLVAAPFTVLSQRPGKICRIGYLHPAAPDSGYTALREALIGLGYVDGRNVAFEERFAGGKRADEVIQ